MEVKSLGLYLFSWRKGHHHVVNDIVMLAEGIVRGTLDALMGSDHRIISHIVYFCIDVLLLIATSEKYLQYQSLYWYLSAFLMKESSALFGGCLSEGR